MHLARRTERSRAGLPATSGLLFIEAVRKDSRNAL
jgi:hypothetical protein